MEKKIVVPDGMLEAAQDAWGNDPEDYCLPEALEAALRWLSENPIVPTEEQLQAVADEHGRGKCYPEAIVLYVVGFQKRMFLAPEGPPEEIKDLWNQAPAGGSAQEAIIEAFRRGQKSRS